MELPLLSYDIHTKRQPGKSRSIGHAPGSIRVFCMDKLEFCEMSAKSDELYPKNHSKNDQDDNAMHLCKRK